MTPPPPSQLDTARFENLLASPPRPDRLPRLVV